MRKILGLLKIAMLSILFIGCNAYQLASYYEDSDGIYVSSDRGIDYEVVFSEYADETLNSYSSTDNIGNLPWGANPETTEVVNNFSQALEDSIMNPFLHNMAINPFLLIMDIYKLWF